MKPIALKPYAMSAFQEIKDYLLITFGLFLYSFGLTYFMLPYEITTGGVAGVGSIIYYATGFEVQNTYLIVNAALLIAAIKVLGWKFCFRTIYAVLVLTAFIWAMQRIAEGDNGVLPRACNDQTFMACIIGACLEGSGLAICFLSNGSTGGTDIIAAIVNKYKNMSLGSIIMLCDVFIISSCYFVFHDWQRVVFGVATLIVSSVTLDFVVNKQRQSVQFMIFSRNYRKIADAINATGRGVTVLDGTGWYTRTERKVIVVLVKKRESINIFRMIKSIDPYAFVSMGNVQGVYGEGFDPIKASVKTNKGKKTIVFASNNQHKLEEIRAILGDKFEVRSLEDIGCHDDIPETSGTLEGNALQKAEYIKQFYGYDCFADDTGLECTALDGEPGVYSARYAGGDGHDSEANMQKLLQNLESKKDRTAQFRTGIALIYNGSTHYFEGTVKGEIATEKHGDGGFGYDPIFVTDGHEKTFAELGSDVKNTISHRALAVEKLVNFLNQG